MNGGISVKKAALFNLLSDLTELLGALTGFILGKGVASVIPVILSLAAGGFIYIACTDLFPEMRERTGAKALLRETVALTVGLFLILALNKFLG